MCIDYIITNFDSITWENVDHQTDSDTESDHDEECNSQHEEVQVESFKLPMELADKIMKIVAKKRKSTHQILEKLLHPGVNR